MGEDHTLRKIENSLAKDYKPVKVLSLFLLYGNYWASWGKFFKAHVTLALYARVYDLLELYPHPIISREHSRRY